MTPALAAAIKARSFSACLRPGRRSTPVATSTPQGWTSAIASATFVGSKPPARIRRSLSGAPSVNRQSKTWPDPGDGASIMMASAPYEAAPVSAGSPATKAWMRNGTRSRTKRACSGVSRPCSCAPRKPVWLTISTTRSGVSLRNTPTVRISGGRRFTMSAARAGAIWRGDGAKMKPTASAPNATARSASSSLVVPQTLTNMEQRYRSACVDTSYERTNGAGAVGGGDNGLADEDGVVAGIGEAGDVSGIGDTGFGNTDDVRRDGGGHDVRPLAIDLERVEVTLVDADNVGTRAEGPRERVGTVDLDERGQAE